jgi:hypothetical protein
MSETTFLLPEANINRNINSNINSNSNCNNSSLELGTLSPSESMEEQDDVCKLPFVVVPLLHHKQRSLHASYKMALVGILAFGIAVRLFGFTTTTVQQQAERESGAHGSLMVPSSSSSSLQHWDDETHHEWEDFLAASHNQRQDSSSFEADLGAAAGNLLGSTTKTREKADFQSAEISESAVDGGSSELLYFNQTTAFAMLNPMEADFFHYQNGWEAQITQVGFLFTVF